MSGRKTHDCSDGSSGLSFKMDEYATDELERLRDELTEELNRRTRDINLDEAEKVELVNNQFVPWAELSAHANTKAVKPWILHVTGTHEKYGVDGDWLNKQKIDDSYHMDVSELEQGDILKVSGASHSNKKHRYYRVLAIEDGVLYYEPTDGLEEATVIETVG